MSVSITSFSQAQTRIEQLENQVVLLSKALGEVLEAQKHFVSKAQMTSTLAISQREISSLSDALTSVRQTLSIIINSQA